MLDLTDIDKAFGPVKALDGVHLRVPRGTVHALVGENGAGKSTLMKILSGALPPDAGTMSIDGRPYRPRSPRDGRAAGIGMIYQELTVAPHLSVIQNMMLGQESARFGWIRPRRADARAALDRLGQADIDLDVPAGTLSIGKQQIVEIARTLLRHARIMVLDEPTRALSAADAQALFEVVERLRAEGVTLVYISHFLEDVVRLCDGYTVLRDGHTVASGSMAGVTPDDLIEPMIGRAVGELYPARRHAPAEPLLTVAHVRGRRGVPREASFTLRRGEVMGLAGLVGAGRSALLRTLFGLRPGTDGTVQAGTHGPVRIALATPARSLAQGLNLLSEDRKDEGLAVNLSLTTNITLSALARYARRGLVDAQRERAAAGTWIDRLGIRSHTTEQPAASLSGGNQQKLCLARLLHHDSDILLLDEPTRGIDIGSKADMYRLIDDAAARGKGVVVASSYLPELFGICDTLAVMHRGSLSDVRPVDAWTEASVMRYATSGR